MSKPKKNDIRSVLQNEDSKKDIVCGTDDSSDILEPRNTLSSGILSLVNSKYKKHISGLSDQQIAKLLEASCIYSNGLNIASQSASAIIGQTAELDFYELCKKLPAGYILHNTAKAGKKGDFILTYSYAGREYTCLVEIKKYKTTIPTRELAKFQTDLTSGNYDCGLFISVSSKITGIPPGLSIIETNIPRMYLSEVSDDITLHAIQLLMLKIIVFKQRETKLTNLEASLQNINNTLEHSYETRRILCEMQNDLNSSVNKCQQNLLSIEVKIKHSIEQIYKILET